METTTETTGGGIKKAVRPKKRTITQPENPNPQPAEGLGETESTNTATEAMGLDAAPDPAAGEAKRGRGRPPGSTSKAAAPAAPAVEVSAAEGVMVVTAIGQLKAWFFVKFLGVPADLAPMVAYDTEQAEALGAVAAPVLQKYIPKNIGRFKEEIQLALTLYAVEQAKYQQLKLVMEQRAAAVAIEVPLAAAA